MGYFIDTMEILAFSNDVKMTYVQYFVLRR